MWSRGDIRQPLEPASSHEAPETCQQDLPPSPLFPRKEVFGSRHYSTFSPPVASVCTPKYKRKIRDAVPFVTPSTGVPRTPSIWTQMTDRQNQFSTTSFKPKTTTQAAESARSASRVTKVHIQAMRRGSGDPRRIDERQLLFPVDDLSRSPDFTNSHEKAEFNTYSGSARAFDGCTPNLPMKTPLPINSRSTVTRIHRRASTGVKGTMDQSASSQERDSSTDIATPGRVENPSSMRDNEPDHSDPSGEPEAPRATDDYYTAMLDAEALIDEQILMGNISDDLRKELDIPTDLPRFRSSTPLDLINSEMHRGSTCEAQLPFADFATLYLIVNGMPLQQQKLSDGTHEISLYTGGCRQMFEGREKEFNASFDRCRGETLPFSKAALWFSRNTVCQRCDTQLTSCFTKYGEIAIQTQLLNHMKGGVKRRDAVWNCYKTLDNLHQKCDQSKYDEKRRIQNLMRRLAECIIAVFVAQILPHYSHPDLAEVKSCLEELDFDEDSLIWCITMSFTYSGVIYGCFWDWMASHDLIADSVGGVQLECLRAALLKLQVVPSELSETDIAEVLQCISLPSSERQMAAFAANGDVSRIMITRDDFSRTLTRVPFNHPDFQLMTSEDTVSDNLLPDIAPRRFDVEISHSNIEQFMQELLSVADLISKTILHDITSNPAELELVKKRVSKTYNSPGTATECQKRLNIRSDEFISQDFLASFIVSYEEIQLMLAASPYVSEKPLISCRPNFPPIKMINLAMQLMITCVTLAMTPSERYALRNPMGPLAVNVNESAILSRAKEIVIPLPLEIPNGKQSCRSNTSDQEQASRTLTLDDRRLRREALHIPKNYRIVVESLHSADSRIQEQRAESLARLIDGPKLKQNGGELTAMSWGSRPALDFEVRSDEEDLSDNACPHARAVHDTITQLESVDAKKSFILLNSAESLIESARIILSGIKSFPTPAVPLDHPELLNHDSEKWTEFWEQQSKLAERINLQSGSLRWTSLILILNLFVQIRPHIFNKP